MYQHLVYALTDPRSGEIRYIGKSSSGVARPQYHLSPAHIRRETTRKARWLQSLLALGLRAQIEVVEECGSVDHANEAERFWISQFRALGFRLTNLTDGGDGAPGRIMTDEHKKKIGLTAIGNTRMLGKKMSESAREKIARSAMGNKRGAKLSAEEVEQIRRLRSLRVPRRELAERFGVSTQTISNIGCGRTWVN